MLQSVKKLLKQKTCLICSCTTRNFHFPSFSKLLQESSRIKNRLKSLSALFPTLPGLILLLCVKQIDIFLLIPALFLKPQKMLLFLNIINFYRAVKRPVIQPPAVK